MITLCVIFITKQGASGLIFLPFNQLPVLIPPDNTIFTFGIGTEINTHLLDKITQQTKAYRTYITPEEDIEPKFNHVNPHLFDIDGNTTVSGAGVVYLFCKVLVPVI